MVAFAAVLSAGNPQRGHGGGAGVDPPADPAGCTARTWRSSGRIPGTRGLTPTWSATRTTIPIPRDAPVSGGSRAASTSTSSTCATSSGKNTGRDGHPLKLVVCDLSTSPMVDLAGAAHAEGAARENEEVGIRLRLASAHGRRRLRAREAGRASRLFRPQGVRCRSYRTNFWMKRESNNCTEWLELIELYGTAEGWIN